MKVTPLTLKKKLALELWREQNKLAVRNCGASRTS